MSMPHGCKDITLMSQRYHICSVLPRIQRSLKQCCLVGLEMVHEERPCGFERLLHRPFLLRRDLAEKIEDVLALCRGRSHDEACVVDQILKRQPHRVTSVIEDHRDAARRNALEETVAPRRKAAGTQAVFRVDHFGHVLVGRRELRADQHRQAAHTACGLAVDVARLVVEPRLVDYSVAHRLEIVEESEQRRVLARGIGDMRAIDRAAEKHL